MVLESILVHISFILEVQIGIFESSLMDVIAKLPCRDANLYQVGVVLTVPVSPDKYDAAEGRHDMKGHDAVYIPFCFW